jgi:heme/copper-type cytochrome/quinol oxidase subunit 3
MNISLEALLVSLAILKTVLTVFAGFTFGVAIYEISKGKDKNCKVLAWSSGACLMTLLFIIVK